eukprot:2736484-Pyramimonas_sp.AAC.2
MRHRVPNPASAGRRLRHLRRYASDATPTNPAYRRVVVITALKHITLRARHARVVHVLRHLGVTVRIPRRIRIFRWNGRVPPVAPVQVDKTPTARPLHAVASGRPGVPRAGPILLIFGSPRSTRAGPPPPGVWDPTAGGGAGALGVRDGVPRVGLLVTLGGVLGGALGLRPPPFEKTEERRRLPQLAPALPPRSANINQNKLGALTTFERPTHRQHSSSAKRSQRRRPFSLPPPYPHPGIRCVSRQHPRNTSKRRSHLRWY